jgi:hypothetical protein
MILRLLLFVRVSLFFFFLLLLIVDTIQRRNSESERSVHTHTFALNIGFASSYYHQSPSLSITSHCQSLECATMFPTIKSVRQGSFLFLFSLYLFTVVILIIKNHQIACIPIYDVQRMYLLKMNDYFIYVYLTVGHIHSCHHTYLFFIYTFYWRE